MINPIKERKNEIIAIILFALSFFLLLGLISFDARDVSWMTYPPQVPAKNWTGTIGAYISGTLIYLLGLGSYILIALFSALGWRMFKEKKVTKYNILGVVLLLLVSCSFLAFIPFNMLTKSGNFNGGFLGKFIASFAVKYFGNIGSYIVLLTFFILSILLVTEFSITDLKKPKKRELKKDDKENINEIILPEPDEEKEFIEKPMPVSGEPVILGAAKPKKPLQAQFDFVNELYEPPPLDLLSEAGTAKEVSKEKLLEDAKTLEDTLNNFGISVKVTQISRGPVITRFELQPAAGVRVSSIVALSNDLALSLAVPSVRMEAPIPGKAAVGIEIPNKDPDIVCLRDMLETEGYQKSDSKLTICLGKDVAGNPIVSALDGMPHLLIAGATGSGKTAFIHSFLLSIIYRSGPSDVKFVMIDPKRVELTVFEGIQHLARPVIKEPKEAGLVMKWLINEMEGRFRIFLEKGVNSIKDYNQSQKEKMPYLVVIIDEMADLMMVAPLEVEDNVCRLAQKGRAVGIHLVLATQRPSVDVITGIIKANFPSRVSFAVSTQVDSRTILDIAGAEKLIGKGDMLFSQLGASKPARIQGPFVTLKEVKKVVTFLKEKYGTLEFAEENFSESFEDDALNPQDDELFKEAIKLVVRYKQASTSLLQRKFKIGYNRAARIIDAMQEKNIIGPADGSKPRSILVDENYLNSL